MSPRRLAAVALAVACAACGGTPKAAAPEGPALHLAPLTDLAQGAGLVWLADVSPRALLASPGMADAVTTALPKETTQGFAEKNGGLDVLALDELLVATYDAGSGAATTLYLARGAGLDRGAIEAAFKRRAQPEGASAPGAPASPQVDGRAIDAPGDAGIVRVWGTIGGERQQLALLGTSGVGLEIGRFGPLRVAELFAEQRLRRASPALRLGPLARASELLRGGLPDDPPARAFALGPFEGETAKALGGLLAATTAAGLAARPTRAHERAALAVTLVLIGGWGASAKDAAERLHAAFDRAAASPLGRLVGFDRPIEPVRVEALPDALRLTLTVDAVALGRGVRAATGAEVREMMSY